MPDLVIALLPPLPDEQWSWREIAAELAAYGYAVQIVEDLHEEEFSGQLDLDGAWVSHCALDLAALSADAQLLLVAHGDSARLVAAVGFSQRAARRQVVGYVLVEGDLPKPGTQDWPDAPVTYVGEREATLAGLRGWEIVPGADIAAALRHIAAVSV